MGPGGADARVATATIVVRIPASGAVADLLGGRAYREVFTSQEARRCSARTGLTGWAGRYAAKLAVARLLATDELTGIEILPDSSRCHDTNCTASHPPAVYLAAGPAARLGAADSVSVTITHTRRLAVAVAVVSRRDASGPVAE